MTSSEQLPDSFSPQWFDTEAFVARLKEGDGVAWAILYDRYHPQLRNDIWSSLRARGLTWYTESEVDDIAQTVWKVFLEDLPIFEWRGPGMLYRFLRSTARFTVLNYEQEKRRHSPLDYELLDDVFPRWQRVLRALDGPAIIDEAEMNATLAEITHAARQLNERQRLVLVFFFLDSLTIPEIADYLGKTPSAVQATLRRALEAVQRYWQLGNLYNPPDPNSKDSR